jgi:hypothetical protein
MTLTSMPSWSSAWTEATLCGANIR